MNGREELGSIIVYEECSSIPCEVTDKDIVDYGYRLGVDPTEDKVLCAIIRGWILQPLPHYWFPCHDVLSQNWFYFNSLNGQSSWKHPLEDIHQTLAKEYLRKHPTSRSTVVGEQRIDFEVSERGNPEGESTEPSMESGSTKLPTTNLLAPIGLTKNVLPRTLAPLRRVPKLPESVLGDQSSPLTDVLSIQPNLFPSQQIARETTVGTKPREVDFSNLSAVPKVDTSQFLDAIPLTAPARNTKNLPLPSSHTGQTTEPGISASIPKPLNPLTRSVQLKALQTSKAPDVEQKEPLSVTGNPLLKSNRNVSTSSNLSFTERLAAKKASRNKVGETKAQDTIRTSDATVLTNTDRKRVQFSLGTGDVRNYTPEYSDENNGVEDETSVDVLELLGDPQQLQPAESDNADMLSPKFEEKRWDVGLSSFVGGSNSNSPIHKIPLQQTARSVGSISVPQDGPSLSPINEMVTHFTSRLETQTFQISSTESTVINATSSPIHIDSVLDDQKSTVELNPPVLETPSPSHKAQISETKISILFEGVRRPPLMPQLADFIHEPDPDPGSNEEANASQDSLGMVSSVPCSLKDVSPTSVETQERSIFDVEVKSNSVPGTRFVGSSLLPAVDDIFHGTSNEITKCSLSAPLSNQDAADTASPSPAQPNVREISEVSNLMPKLVENVPSTDEASLLGEVAHRSAMEEMAKMKREMETKLEQEKERLEQWFRDKIAQMKREFEEELDSERRLCNDLLGREKDKLAASVVQIIEHAKSEKEELARREIQLMEERFTHLLQEKKHQIQTLIQECDANEVKSLPVSPRHQDVAIQTENPQPKFSTSVDSDTKSLLHPSKKVDKESDEKKNESFATDSTSTPSTNTEQNKAPPPSSCECKTLKKQIANVEKEMEYLKHQSITKTFRKNSTPKRPSKLPVKAIRDDWWVDDSDESTSTISSSVTTSEFQKSRRGRSQSLTNLHAPKETFPATPVHRARRILSKNKIQKKAWMDDVSPTDLSSVETLTSSGVTSSTSPVSNYEWENVLHSIQKISGDLRQVWSHIGGTPNQSSRSTSYAHRSKSPLLAPSSLPWFSLEKPSFHRVPLHWPLTGSTAERTQALRQWLQQNNNKTQFI